MNEETNKRINEEINFRSFQMKSLNIRAGLLFAGAATFSLIAFVRKVVR
jgi:hypothetical protein